MRRQPFNLQREFIRWFYDEWYPQVGSNRSMTMQQAQPLPGGISWQDYWMTQAFRAGAEAMWHDLNSTLLDYATAVEGLDPEMLEPCEVYDRARENLHAYVKQLELFDAN
jgi:hypothetical protein